MLKVLTFSAAGALLAACACAWTAAAHAQPIREAEVAALERLKEEYRRPKTIPFPQTNPYSPEKAALGKLLYFDPRVSRAQNMNCASCHNPSFGWEAPLSKAIGAQNMPLARHAPTLVNLAWSNAFFWDGRAPSLEDQAKGPIEAADEMNMPLDELVLRLKKIEDYAFWFDKVFPIEGLSGETIVKAIATYERTIVSSYAPFDRCIDGDDQAISASAKRGFLIFTGKAKCANCHSGWNFTDNGFHDIGLASDDPGRGRIEPQNAMARKAFKTPSLRDLSRRMPFMHNGSKADLKAVIRHYRSGGVARPSRSKHVGPFALSGQELGDLLSFLKSLTGEKEPVALPILPN